MNRPFQDRDSRKRKIGELEGDGKKKKRSDDPNTMTIGQAKREMRSVRRLLNKVQVNM